MILKRFFLLPLCLALSACTSVNKQLNPNSVPLENRLTNHTRASMTSVDDSPVFVGVALSGGGSRAANFSAACLFQLQRIGFMKHVDSISSVSGGSLAAAYYCLNDQAWNPQAAQKKLTHAFAADLWGETLMPWNWIALSFSDYDRSDLLANSFDHVLFSPNGKSQTFSDLLPGRPHLLINATDLQSGDKFVFDNIAFDAINSDLGKYPVARAVAASSGVADNLGLQTLVEAYEKQVNDGNNHAYPRGAVFIVIDAMTHHDARLSSNGDIGFLNSLIYGTGLTSTALLNRASTATLAELITKYAGDNTTAAELRTELKSFEQEGIIRLTGKWNRPITIVHLALTQTANLPNQPFHSFCDTVNNIATYFNITDADAYSLYQAAELLVQQQFEPKLKQILREIESGK
jgi:hypothetical protein